MEYKIGQKLVFMRDPVDGKEPAKFKIVEVTGVYYHPDNSEPTYFLSGYETDFDGLKQVFPHECLGTYLQLV